jgi:hypothetical protein
VRKYPRAAILALFLLVMVPGKLKAEADTRPSLAVLGVACDARSDEWRNGLVGFGIENWVAQSFYDTGKYRMFEERQDVVDQLRAKTDEAYDQAHHNKIDDLSSIAKQLSVDIVVVGQVSTEYSLSQQVSIGPFHSLNRDTIVKVDVCIYDARTGKITRADASGKVGRQGHSFAADYRGGKLPFDPSTVAPATEQAVEGAVAKLVPDYRPHARRDHLAEFKSTVAIGVLPLALEPTVAANYPELKSKRVAFGIQSRIARAVSDTKNCSLQEIDPAVLDNLAEQWWISSKGAPPTDDVKKQAPAYKSTVGYIVYGEVFAFSIAHLEHAEGLSGKVADKVTLGVQLRAVDPSSGEGSYIVASGMGSATGDWEHWRGQADDFEQSFVGQAATTAIQNAWAALSSDLAGHK